MNTLDSFSEKTDDDRELAYDSKNMKTIKQVIVNHDLLEFIFPPESRIAKHIRCMPKQLLYIVQVVLAPAILSEYG